MFILPSALQHAEGRGHPASVLLCMTRPIKCCAFPAGSPEAALPLWFPSAAVWTEDTACLSRQHPLCTTGCSPWRVSELRWFTLTSGRLFPAAKIRRSSSLIIF